MTSGLTNLISLFLSITTLAGTPTEIHVPARLTKKLKSFEPSAVTYLEESESFLLAIDDTDKKDTAMLFIMSSEGEVAKSPLLFDGIDTMTDIESLSQDRDYLYVLSSQSRNKKGKVLQERNWFVRGKFNNTEIVETESLELRPLLLKALQEAGDPTLKNMRAKYDSLLETEAHYISDGHLFVGLKDPQPRPGIGLILDLGDVNQIFTTGTLDSRALKVAHEINFGNQYKISDIALMDSHLAITTTREEGGGAIWRFERENGNLEKLRSFDLEKPEGIAPVPNSGAAMVVFDQGDEPGLFSQEEI